LVSIGAPRRAIDERRYQGKSANQTGADLCAAY
jgi:hypothetical protein